MAVACRLGESIKWGNLFPPRNSRAIIAVIIIEMRLYNEAKNWEKKWKIIKRFWGSERVRKVRKVCLVDGLFFSVVFVLSQWHRGTWWELLKKCQGVDKLIDIVYEEIS